jgi:hypothetical protein
VKVFKDHFNDNVSSPDVVSKLSFKRELAIISCV